jgi:CxxC-x17-CxxC domain-containing protein
VLRCVRFKTSGARCTNIFVTFQDQQDQGGRGGWQDRPMYDIKCSNCGADAQVPFQPTAGRNVYCRDCFRQMNPSPSRDGGGRGGRSGGGGFRSR